MGWGSYLQVVGTHNHYLLSSNVFDSEVLGILKPSITSPLLPSPPGSPGGKALLPPCPKGVKGVRSCSTLSPGGPGARPCSPSPPGGPEARPCSPLPPGGPGVRPRSPHPRGSRGEASLPFAPPPPDPQGSEPPGETFTT